MKRTGGFSYRLRCAWQGLVYAGKTQSNMRIHAVILLLVLLAGCYFKLSLQQWIWILLVSAAVFITETINTAIETTVDLVTLEYNSLAKLAKDVAAAAVLLAAAQAVIIGFIIFVPCLLRLMR